ncbi:MAG: signal peptidase I [Ruminococcaceae bacterium]|nr:signal peptidase I [Oscillospiraceae bacterium]
MKPKIKKTVKIISSALTAFVVIMAFLLYGTRFIGLTPYTVLSGSMESVYPTGSIIYVKKVQPEKLKVKDPITFKLPNGIIATHRIIETVAPDDGSNNVFFRTKGDENEIADGTLVGFEDIIGKPIFCIPFLGYFANYISYPPGKYVALTIVLALIIIEIMLSIAFDTKKNTDSKQE